MRQTMLTSNTEERFWSGTYRGRTVSVLDHHGRWLVYIDHTLRHHVAFDTADAALTWARRQIDGANPRLAA